MRGILSICLALLSIIALSGPSWAGQFDFNPGHEPVRYKQEMNDDVSGHGFVKEYRKINTNNLSLFEYSHGSGSIDQAGILSSEQKSTHIVNNFYYLDNDGQWQKKARGACSVINYTRQYDNIQSPTAFAYGTGWYASHPIGYNSLLKDKTEARSYQEAASMHRQVEYARGLKGDIAVDINCTGPTATANGIGSLIMTIDDDVTQGTLHVGELVFNPKLLKFPYANTTAFGHMNAWKEPIIEIDDDYIGDFKAQRTLKLEAKKFTEMWGEDWLPCCSGGFFDLPSWDFDKQYSGQKGIFDCTCRNTSLSTMKPMWNGTAAQFPNEDYRRDP
ncbi:MAG TPA: hypothetical protein PLQ38_08560 [Methanothrix sp.]|nr:hypothetical protein [Methanothrix sp.]